MNTRELLTLVIIVSVICGFSEMVSGKNLENLEKLDNTTTSNDTRRCYSSGMMDKSREKLYKEFFSRLSNNTGKKVESWDLRELTDGLVQVAYGKVTSNSPQNMSFAAVGITTMCGVFLRHKDMFHMELVGNVMDLHIKMEPLDITDILHVDQCTEGNAVRINIHTKKISVHSNPYPHVAYKVITPSPTHAICMRQVGRYQDGNAVVISFAVPKSCLGYFYKGITN